MSNFARITLLFLSCVLVSVSAQTNQLPISSFSAVVSTFPGNPAAVSYTPTVYPVSTLVNTDSLNYALEVDDSSDPLELTLSFTFNPLFSSILVTVINCRAANVAQLNPVDSSYCSASNPSQLRFLNKQPFNTTTGSVTVYDIDDGSGQPLYLRGDYVVQVIVQGSDSTNENIVSIFPYLVSVRIGTGAANFLTIGSSSEVSSLLATANNAPYSTLQSSYSLYYTTAAASSFLVRVPFYIVAAANVKNVAVTICNSDCQTGCRNQGLTGNKNSLISVGFPLTGVQQGVFYYTANLASTTVQNPSLTQCLFFNTSTHYVTVSVTVYNCAVFSTCGACTSQADSSCGFCLETLSPIVGNCVPGTTEYSLWAGLTCVSTGSFSYEALPIWIYEPVNCVTVLRGDPRLTGLQGQDFQVHGTPNEYFNLFTTADLQVNSRFVFLQEAECDNFTSCFTHPGTYIDEVGIMQGYDRIRITASRIDSPAQLYINEKQIHVSTRIHIVGSMSVEYSETRRIIVKTNHVILNIQQSDAFFNIDTGLAVQDQALLETGAVYVKSKTAYAVEPNKIMHGLIGQTWRNIVYPGPRDYEGEVADYQVADGIWGTDFHFNLYLP